MSRFELLSLLTSLLAVFIAVVSMIRSSRTAKKQLELQEVQAAFTAFQHKVLAAEQETRRHADLRAEHVGDGSRGKFVFRMWVPEWRATSPLPSLMLDQGIHRL
jgi:hypothetical protein